MGRAATTVTVTAEEQEQLDGWLRSPKTEQRLAFRARVVLAAAAGEGSVSIARREGVRVNTVSTWCMRFAAKGIAGLADEPRAGRPVVYGPETERRVLAKLAQRAQRRCPWQARPASPPTGVAGVHERGRGRLSGARDPRRARQPEHAQAQA